MLGVFVFSAIFVLASVTNLGALVSAQNCSVNDNRLDPVTHDFLSDCSIQDFCSTNNTCVARQCRKDEFPFGYGAGVSLPPMCSLGTFCPDEGSGCEALLSVGQTCQLNRDDECAPPPTPQWQELASSMNFNGSICLQSTCMYSNVTLGLDCIVDNTTYIGSGLDGQQLSYTVIRDNCIKPQLYCSSATLRCEQTAAIGQQCIIDQECETYNCGANNICAESPGTVVGVAPWQYAITSFCILAAAITTCLFLALLHKRHRLVRYHELRDYYFEQTNYRSSIIALHSAAAQRVAYEKSMYEEPLLEQIQE